MGYDDTSNNQKGRVAMNEILAEARRHMEEEDGTLNDSRMEELYRLANGMDEDSETELEDVERWAIDNLA